MFTYEQIQSLNDLEFEVYNYIIKNKDMIFDMRIRELAQEVHVSTTTILRFCKKMGCNGYSELKVKLKMLHLNNEEELSEDSSLVLDYLKKMDTKEKIQQLEEAVELIYQAKRVVFIGGGTSGIMAKYGARYLTSIGKFTHFIDDPYYPVTDEDYTGTVIIAMSVSGETDQLVYRLEHYKKLNARIISITNVETSTIAKMADLSLSYYVPKVEIFLFDITTQMPVLYLIETIGKQLHRLLNEESLKAKTKLL